MVTAAVTTLQSSRLAATYFGRWKPLLLPRLDNICMVAAIIALLRQPYGKAHVSGYGCPLAARRRSNMRTLTFSGFDLIRR